MYLVKMCGLWISELIMDIQYIYTLWTCCKCMGYVRCESMDNGNEVEVRIMYMKLMYR